MVVLDEVSLPPPGQRGHAAAHVPSRPHARVRRRRPRNRMQTSNLATTPLRDTELHRRIIQPPPPDPCLRDVHRLHFRASTTTDPPWIRPPDSNQDRGLDR